MLNRRRCLTQLAVLRPDRQPSANIKGSKWISVCLLFCICTFYILYFLHLVWHNLHFFAETVSRQSISTNQKLIPVGKMFCKEQTTAKTKQSDRKIFVTFGCREKWETRNIFPTNKERRTVNNCQLSKIAKKKTITTMMRIMRMMMMIKGKILLLAAGSQTLG